MSKVADPLREFLTDEYGKDTHGLVVVNADQARDIADEIDRDHERRMEQQSYELSRALYRYLNGVLDDYKHGMERGRG